MFSLAIVIGIYSYVIFALGLMGLLQKSIITIITLLFLLVFLVIKLRKKPRIRFKKLTFTKTEYLILILIIFQALVNLIGVLGPELAFDSLWYHLTLPKIYSLSNSINFIQGGLLYYSAMPKLIEMLYIFPLSFGLEVFAKLTSFTFGILAMIATYFLARKFLDKKYSLLTVLIFYSSLVVGWESITAYVDLSRTFFEVMAFWGFINWIESKEKKWLIESAVMLGLAISTKTVALVTLLIVVILIAYELIKQKEKILSILKYLFTYIIVAIFIPLPWFIFSFLNTGNPFYPLFSSFFNPNLNLSIYANPFNMIFLEDLINPIYIMVLPIIIMYFKSFPKNLKKVLAYCLLAIIFWIMTISIEGGRFILPYTPLFSILAAYSIFILKNKKLKKYMIFLVFIIALISIFYRSGANAKYIPVILLQQSKSDFLTKNLNFKYGDFFDIDDYFKQNIKSNDTVLLYGFHNLYYVDFPFIHSSWVKSGDSFNYIATQNTNLPDRFKNWKLIYQNPTTGVKLYNLYQLRWHY